MVTKVFLDEGGGLPPEIFTAAEAVATGSDSGIITIGNPDRRGTEFHRIFTDDKYKDEWKTSTISAFDLPTFTGEKVYDDPERQAKLLKALTSPEWVEHKRRAWGEGDARWMSKVLGEFPGEADNTFFGQHVIDKAHDTEIEEDLAVRPTLGVDVARWGEDESVIMCNRNGRIRLMDDWGKADTVDSARRIHGHAQSVMAERVQIDASGIGGAVYDMLTTLAEFDDRVYDVVAIDGGYRSPDNARWSNMRAYAHDNLRELMLRGEIDLDYDDKKLRDELIAITYRFNQRGAIQITPKEEMRTAIGGSPDRLDAVIYAALDHTVLLAPEGGIAVIEPEEIPDFGFHDLITSEGWPM